MKHEKFYLKNKKYTEILESQDSKSFNKYISFLKKGKVILDYGCGTGFIVDTLSSFGKKAYGVDVSISSITFAKKNREGKFYVIRNNKLPFKNNFFDCVGCNNVLEHVDNPEKVMSEMVRILKKRGIIVISGPNFLSITNSYHRNVAGWKNKLKNFLTILYKLFLIGLGEYKPYFEKMRSIYRKEFKSDDDAVNAINPVDVVQYLKNNHIKIIYYSGDQIGNKKIIFNNMPFFWLFFGSIFIVGVKNE